jgi:hypothetical protein
MAVHLSFTNCPKSTRGHLQGALKIDSPFIVC